MTLCKFMPQRTYCARWTYEKDDVIGLMKALDSTVADFGEVGMSSTPYYVGALVACSILFKEDQKGIDTWVDFMRDFGDALEELEGD